MQDPDPVHTDPEFGGPPLMTEIQQNIFAAALEMSWKDICRTFQLTNESSLQTCLLRTAQGYIWYPGMAGGSDFYLSNLYEQRLIHIIESKANDHRCISLPDLLMMAAVLRNQMFDDAHRRLQERKCQRLAKQITAKQAQSEAPSESWAYGLAERHKLRIVEGQSIEHARNVACDRTKIAMYFTRWLPEFNRDPMLIFGADETDVRIDYKERVITTARQQGHVEEDEPIKHLTALCCHSAGGVALPPFFVLAGLQNLPPELSRGDIDNPDVAWFGASLQGWMNEGLFYAWCMLFCCWISGYRATTLPAHLKGGEILLILDGHNSRRCPEAIDLLRLHNIKVLILPAHTTHLLQAFDVHLAAPLKSHFKRFLSLAKRALRGDPNKPTTKAGRSRYIAVTAFLRAWESVATGPMCARSFAKIGVYPADPLRVLQSPFVVERADYPLGEKATLNNELFTTDQMRDKLIMEKQTCGWDPSLIPTVNAQLINVGQWPLHAPVVQWMRTRELAHGKLFSQPRDLFYPFPHWRLMETFPRYVTPLMTPLQIAAMQQQLAADQQQRVENLDAEVERIAADEGVELSAEMIRTTASRMAEGMVAEKLAERSSMLSQQFVQTLTQISGLLGEMPEATRRQLDALMEDCRRLGAPEQGED